MYNATHITNAKIQKWSVDSSFRAESQGYFVESADFSADSSGDCKKSSKMKERSLANADLKKGF